MKFSEHVEQANLVKWARKHNIFCFSVPNGFVSNAKQAVLMKQEGLLAGVPDLVFCFPNGKTVFIEMKIEGGHLSDKQNEIHKQLRELGFEVFICWSCFEATKILKKLLDKYLSV